MSDIFIHVYLDEDVHGLVARLLRQRSFPVTTTIEAGNMGQPDEEQLAYAATHGMAILTHNRNDFSSWLRATLIAEPHTPGSSLPSVAHRRRLCYGAPRSSIS